MINTAKRGNDGQCAAISSQLRRYLKATLNRASACGGTIVFVGLRALPYACAVALIHRLAAFVRRRMLGANTTVAHDAVNTILLVSSDVYLEQRLRAALRFDERLRRYRTRRELVRDLDDGRQVVVLDHRGRDIAQLNAELAAVGAAIGPETGVIALSSGPDTGPFDIISTTGNRAREIILGDFHAVPFLIRAELNGKSNSGAAMIALYALTRYLPDGTHPILCEVLGSGLRYSSVKQLAVLWREDRGTIRRRLDVLGYGPDELVQLSIASLAAAELRTTDLRLDQIARFAGYSRLSKLDPLLLRVFGMSASMIRDDIGPADGVLWLRAQLDAAHAAATDRRRRQKPRNA